MSINSDVLLTVQLDMYMLALINMTILAIAVRTIAFIVLLMAYVVKLSKR